MLSFGFSLLLSIFPHQWQDAIVKNDWIQVRSSDEAVFLIKNSNAPSSYWVRLRTH